MIYKYWKFGNCWCCQWGSIRTYGNTEMNAREKMARRTISF